MRQEAGWAAAIAVAIAAAIGMTSQQGDKSPAGQSASASRANQQDSTGSATVVDFYLGPCAQIESHLKSFLGMDDQRSTVIPASCSTRLNGGASVAKRNNAGEQEDRAKDQSQSQPVHLSFMIATLPDPTHTHFPLQFDRMAEAIQQGASDEGYVYDSSWLPWTTKDDSFSSLADQDIANSRKDAQEEQPGILLFRRKPVAGATEIAPASLSLPYREGLIVFIVGEEPTQGIHREQFKNATAWVAALQTHDSNKHQLPPIILGPSFSGSVYSLADLVSDPRIEQSPAPRGAPGNGTLRIYSGNITGNKALTWITSFLGAKAQFASFQHSDGFLISRYCDYLSQSKFDLSRFAILSEDQTAYGSEVVRLGADKHNAPSQNLESDSTEPTDDDLSSCHLGSFDAGASGTNSDQIVQRPLRVFYPRDISALRAAYQSESIFSSPSTSTSDTAQRTLAPDVADPEGNQHDSIHSYSGDQTALSQEAVLQQIVSQLRVHQSQYILLRSSNVLDQIFLSHYLRLAYPQGRIVILGADQLLRRESGAARLSGIMTLTTYPLLPWEPHWTQRLDDPGAHSHRVFAQDRSEGVYVAARALLHFPVTLDAETPCTLAVEHLVLAGYKVETAAGDAGQDPKLLCKSDLDAHPFSLLAGKNGAGPELTLTFAINHDGSHTLDSIGTGPEPAKGLSGAKQESLPSSSTESYALPIPPLAGFVPVDPELTIPDYRAPFWIDPAGQAQKTPQPPVAWLSVLGRNDFWPLAALTTKTINEESLCGQLSRGLRHNLWPAFRSVFNVFAPREYGGTDCNSSGKDRPAASPATDEHEVSIPPWQPMPAGIRLALAALLIGCGFHLLCCLYPSVTQKPGHRAYFVCVGRCRLPYLALMLLGSVTISAAASVLACGFGAMSPDGAPLSNPGLWLLSHQLFWCIAGVALAINVSKQPFVSSPDPKAAAGAVKAASHATQATAEKWWSSKRWNRYCEAANNDPRKWLAVCGSVIFFLLGTLAAYFAVYFSAERTLTVASRVPAYWRSMDLTDGVSPVVPLLAVCVGMYLWFWYSLQGLALLGRDRPRLPLTKCLTLEGHDPLGAGETELKALRLFSREGVAIPVEKLCSPFAPKVLIRAAVLFALQMLLVFFLEFRRPLHLLEFPLRSLGARSYSIAICFLMGLLFSIMMANAWQLVNVWRELRKLLTHLDRIPLRRSMAAFPGVSWNSVWKISGNVLDMRYKLLTNQLRCVTYLKNRLAARDPLTLPLSRPADVEMNASIRQIERAQLEFAQWYSEVYDKRDVLDQQPVEKMQKQLANFAGFLLTRVLVPAWRQEKGEPLDAYPEGDVPPTREKEREELTPVSQLDSHIRHAEQLVCYVYLGFIQNVLGRMRSLVMCMLWLFIAATVSMADYPFDPRPAISCTMVLLFGVLTTAIVFVCAQIHRDPILSLVTNTKPGELGGDFWLKLLGFGAGPVLGLLTTLFPQLTDFLFSWVQPGISSIK